jgi:hypothetical protein
MSRFLFGVFIVLHGLVHVWYLTLSQRLVEFQQQDFPHRGIIFL